MLQTPHSTELNIWINLIGLNMDVGVTGGHSQQVLLWIYFYDVHLCVNVFVCK